MNDDQPSQPLTEGSWAMMSDKFIEPIPPHPLTDAELAQIREDYEGVDSCDSVPRPLAEVDRLRAELEGWKDNAEDTLRMYDKLKSESTGTALCHLAKIERLQSQRDALVRKLGLDWGPDEFGDLDAVPTEGSADRREMLNDLQWYISDLGPEHWQNCDVGDEDCYLCAGHVAIRDRWKGVE